MSKVVYEVTLSPDGKYSVSVKSDDPLSLKDALPLAKKIQEWVSGVDQPKAPAPETQPTAPQSALQQPQAPLCGVHSTPMTQVQGKHGPFWSCHQRHPDGSWCTYRPTRAASTSSMFSFPPA